MLVLYLLQYVTGCLSTAKVIFQGHKATCHLVIGVCCFISLTFPTLVGIYNMVVQTIDTDQFQNEMDGPFKCKLTFECSMAN